MDKKLILCSMLALAIGVAVVVPVEYFMLAEAQTTSDLTRIDPWFSVNVTYAYCNPYNNGGNTTTQLYGSSIQAVANFTVTADALKDADTKVGNFTVTTDGLKGADAQIEYYKFAVSSDQGAIVDMGYYIVLDKENIVTGTCGDGTISFANGLTYNGPASNGGKGINWAVWKPDTVVGFVSNYIFGTDPNNVPEEVIKLRNAQTLYIDVSKVCTVTVKGDITITKPATEEVLQHIELTKTADGFVYGNYVEGTLPLPITPQPPLNNELLTLTPFGPNNTTQP